MILATLVLLAGSPDMDKLVRSIETVENSSWDSAGGGLQFTKAAWAEETKLEYEKAKNRTVARRIAAQRLGKMAHRLEALGIPVTVRLLGSVWNKGFHGALELRRRGEPCDFGQRVENVFYHE